MEGHQRDQDDIPNQRATETVIRQVIAEEIPPIVVLTQTEYDELDPPDPSTLYFIKEEPE